ncbi:MAG: hypothetical protein GEU86_19740 [Actinophytocola sp.]|nr:hypothetical protein [Actinophytocola sp.]
MCRWVWPRRNQPRRCGQAPEDLPRPQSNDAVGYFHGGLVGLSSGRPCAARASCRSDQRARDGRLAGRGAEPGVTVQSRTTLGSEYLQCDGGELTRRSDAWRDTRAVEPIPQPRCRASAAAPLPRRPDPAPRPPGAGSVNADLHTLTGAYVLNALSDTERAAFEEHVAQCDACAGEVRELRETAAQLGSAVAVQTPAELKPQVLERIRRTRQLRVIPLRSRRWQLRLMSLVAAASLIVAVVLGVQVISANRDLDQTEQQLSQLTTRQTELVEVLAAADAQIVTHDRDDTAAAVVVSRELGKLAFVPRRMPAPGPGRTYQLWLITPRDTHSAGLMPDPRRIAVAKTVRDMRQVGVTVEPAGGSKQPTTDPIMQLALP